MNPSVSELEKRAKAARVAIEALDKLSDALSLRGDGEGAVTDPMGSIQMPFPNEHAARQFDPDECQEGSFRRKELTSGVTAILCRRKGENTTSAQSVRFDRKKFTPEEAKKWLKDHNMKSSVEAATGEGKQAREVSRTHWYFVDELGAPVMEQLDGKATSWIQIMRTGHWNHPQFGRFSITTEDILQFVETFESGARGIELAVDSEHQPERGAAGWIKKMDARNGGTELWAFVEWTDWGVELVEKGLFKYISPEFDFKYKDPETGRITENVLFGVALTNRPFLKGMEPVVLSERAAGPVFCEEKPVEKAVELGELLDAVKSRELMEKAGKMIADAHLVLMTAGDLISQHMQNSELSDDERAKKVTAVLKDLPDALLQLLKASDKVKASEALMELVETAAQQRKEARMSGTATGAPAAGEGQQVSLSEHLALKEEVKRLNQMATASQQKADQAEAKLKEMDAEKVVESAIRAGKVTPALKDWAKSYALSDPSGFAKFIEAAPVVVELGERGSGGEGQPSTEGVSASEQIEEKVKKLREQNPKLKYSEALSQVGKEDPTLWEQHREATGKGLRG